MFEIILAGIVGGIIGAFMAGIFVLIAAASMKK